ncbi:unnamed protein product [Gadus morhua 'NCC']
MAHTCRGTINLVTAHIDTEDACNIVLSSGGRTYHLKASTEVERQRWVTALELAKAKAIRMMNDQSAERTIRASLPNVKDIYHKRVESRAKNIRRDDTHPNDPSITSYQDPSITSYQDPSITSYQEPSITSYQEPSITSYHSLPIQPPAWSAVNLETSAAHPAARVCTSVTTAHEQEFNTTAYEFMCKWKVREVGTDDIN